MTKKDKMCFDDDFIRGNFARELRGYFEKYGITDWFVSPSSKKGEILIHPLTGKPENEREISRVSVQINYGGRISLGFSGYNYCVGKCIKEECKDYEYHEKKHNKYGVKENGRWWLTTPLNSLEEVALEFKKREPVVSKERC